MKKLLISLALAVPMFADSSVKLTYNLQTNTPMCIPPVPSASFGCLSKEYRLAGIMALAKSDDPLVTSFLFTATATMADGSTATKTAIVEKQQTAYSAVVIWLAKELSEFSNVQVSVVGQRVSGEATTGTVPNVEY